MNSYEVAESYIARGRWQIDAEAGTITGSRGRELVNTNSDGYRMAKVSGGGRRRQVYQHIVIWRHVHGPVPEGMEIDHVNFVRDDNRIENLAARSHRENVSRSAAAGRYAKPTGELSPRWKPRMAGRVKET